ncbi:TPA_asm: polyprotein [Torreya virus 1]|uniref:Replicase n=1 Tax=Torreya virus 1 TaxID=2977995 RepID=A0A9N6YJK7_9RHAB|nr:TPA_asm: polyprotein [Torreya virus 1]
MDFDWEEEIVDEKSLNDLHLNNAINLDEIKKAMDIHTEYDVFLRRYTKKAADHIKTVIKQLFPTNKILVGHTIILRLIPPICSPKAKNMLSPSMKILLEHIQSANKIEDIMRIPTRDCDSMAVVPYELFVSFEEIMELIIDHSMIDRGGDQNRKCVRYGMATSRTLSYKGAMIFMESQVAAIAVEGVSYMMTKDCILMFMDIVGQRLCLSIFITNSRLYNSMYINEEGIDNILKAGDNYISKRGNQAYTVISMMEALCTGWILKRSNDRVLDKDEFHDTIIGEVKVEINHDVESAEEGWNWVRSLDSFCETSEEDVLSNLFCLYRIYGHPDVNIYGGMKKVHDLGLKEKGLPNVASLQALYAFRKTFCMNFYQKRSKYPRVTCIGDSYLCTSIRDNIKINVRHPGYSNLDWEHVSLIQNWNIPETLNMYHTLSDKAVSPPISEIVEVLSLGKGNFCGDRRRGLLRWMEQDSLPCRTFLEGVQERGIEKDMRVIGLYEKEREMKNDARMFALMSPDIRQYFVTTESMIADYILKYFPEITMKDSLHQLIKKMWDAGKKRSDWNLFINIDFSKWNTNMRENISLPLFKEMDSLFGMTNVISRTHEIFRESLIYSSSGKYHLKEENGTLVLDPPMVYQGHLGGFEGLRQKGWTILTVCLIISAADDLSIRMNLMGQGDNQMITTLLPHGRWNIMGYTEDDKIRETVIERTRILGKLDSTFCNAGLPIKVKETWTSTTLFMYGKNMILGGKLLNQSCKKILRSYALSNEGQLTIEGTTGTIFSNMSAACQTSSHPAVMYMIALILAGWNVEMLLRFHPFTKAGYLSSSEFSVVMPGLTKWNNIRFKTPSMIKVLVSMILIPSSLGGNIIIDYPSFIMRGFPDQVSEGFAWLSWLSKGNNQEVVDCVQAWYSTKLNSTVEPDMLIQAPLSLNLWKPPHPSISTGRIIRDSIMAGTFSDNRFLSGFKKVMTPFVKKEVSRALLTDPINPLLSHEIFETFPEVLIDGIAKRIENTRTLKKISIREGSFRGLIRKMMQQEDNFIKYLLYRGTVSDGDIFSTCPTRQAEEARDAGWGRKIISVTTPHPLGVLSSPEQGHHEGCDREFLLAIKMGYDSCAPYLGSRVREKVLNLADKDSLKEPITVRAAKLSRIENWVLSGKPNLSRVLSENLSTVFSASPISSSGSSSLSAGSVTHRFQSDVTSGGTFINYSANLGMSVYISSDFLSAYNKGKTNFTFMFQAMNLWNQYIVSKCEPGPYHIHIKCSKCPIIVNDEPPDLESIPPSISSLWDSDHRSEVVDMIGEIQSKPSEFRDSDLEDEVISVIFEVDHFKRDVLKEGIESFLAYLCAIQIVSDRSAFVTEVGTEDLQGFSRIWGSKINIPNLLRRTVYFTGILICSSRPILLSKENRRLFRNTLLDALRKCPSSSLTKISSLMLGYDRENLILENINIPPLGSYPITISNFTENIRSCLISLASTIQSSSPFIRCIIIPRDFLSERTLLNCYKLIALDHYKCEVCSSEFNRASHSKDVRIVDGHVLEVIKWVKGVNSLLDKVMKGIDIVNRPVKQDEVFFYTPMCQKVCLRETTVTRCNLSLHKHNDLSYLRSITLPTSSIYKWSDIIQRTNIREPFIIMIGDGTGMTSKIFSSYYPGSTIFPLSLYDNGSKPIPQETWSLIPPLSVSKNINHSMTFQLPSDVTSEKWKPCFHEIVVRHKPFVVSDIEMDRDNSAAEIIMEALPIGTNFLIKYYLGGIIRLGMGGLQSADPLSIIISPVANNHHGEVFFMGTKASKGYFRSKDDILSLANTQILPENVAKYISEVDRLNSSYLLYSVQVAMGKMSTYGLVLSMDDMEKTEEEMVSRTFWYIRSHYSMVKERRRSKGDVIRPLIRLKLERGLCVILSAVIDESNIDLISSLSSFKIIFSEEQNRVTFINTLGHQNGFNHNDLLVARSVKGFRRSLGLDAIPFDIPLGDKLSRRRNKKEFLLDMLIKLPKTWLDVVNFQSTVDVLQGSDYS